MFVYMSSKGTSEHAGFECPKLSFFASFFQGVPVQQNELNVFFFEDITYLVLNRTSLDAQCWFEGLVVAFVVYVIKFLICMPTS